MAVKWEKQDKGYFQLKWNGKAVMQACSKAYLKNGESIDSRSARLLGEESFGDALTLLYGNEKGLLLKVHLNVNEDIPTVSCAVSYEDKRKVEVASLIPASIKAPEKTALDIWKSLWTKMLFVPYDNTMWLRYEAAPFGAGRKSYDMTVIFKEDTREGMLIGALDFDVWKNAVVCSGTDAKVLDSVCGVADQGSHDSMPHGMVSGIEVGSAAFAVLYGSDYRRLLEQYGDMIHERENILKWEEGTPFGFNSWAGLALKLDESHYEQAGKVLNDLRQYGYADNNMNYNNLDAGWNKIEEAHLVSQVDALHENGQRAGIYDVPFACFEKDFKKQIPGIPGHLLEEILLKDLNGNILPRVDGAVPYDVTNPLWQQFTKWKFDRFIQWGFDYIKLDFLSHGGMEGVHYDSSVTTGRMALKQGYRYVTRLLSPERMGKPFFISLSIAPLFPCGFGHARRFSCDAFGTNEDIEYVLNAQTYAWWENRRLYEFNDPDHICLHKSFCMDRESTAGEARARYTSAVIAGGVMMLSDDYDNPQALERTKLFAVNPEINHLASSRIAFCPVESNQASASRVFTAKVDGINYVAMFHLGDGQKNVYADCKRANLKEDVSYIDLWTGKKYPAAEGRIVFEADCCDAVLLKEATE